MISVLLRAKRNMSFKPTKKTLAQKLIKKERKVVQLRTEDDGIEDIEDVASTKKSLYFSPIQTRWQRMEKSLQLQNEVIEEKDEASPKKSIYFSPVQTRRQRKDKSQQLEKNVLHSEAPKNVSIKIKEPTWEPTRWLEMLNNIRQMRAAGPAPVDSMGCDKCADVDADEKTQRFHKLVALMLSSQTKDETTFQAMQRLKAHTLTPVSIVSMSATELENLLRPVSFYKNKAKYLQQTSRILIEKYAHDIPNNPKDLMALPGMGPKMTHICMATAWNEVTGIGVDVHVHRITNRLHWLPSESKEPERTRVALEQWLPRNLWAEVNHLLVGFGQTICTPVTPKCSSCLNNSICPSAFKESKKASPKKNSSMEPNLETKKAFIKKRKMCL